METTFATSSTFIGFVKSPVLALCFSHQRSPPLLHSGSLSQNLKYSQQNKHALRLNITDPYPSLFEELIRSYLEVDLKGLGLQMLGFCCDRFKYEASNAISRVWVVKSRWWLSLRLHSVILWDFRQISSRPRRSIFYSIRLSSPNFKVWFHLISTFLNCLLHFLYLTMKVKGLNQNLLKKIKLGY